MTMRRFNRLTAGALAALVITMAISAMGQSCDNIQCTGQIGNLYVTPTPKAGFPNKVFVYVSFNPSINTHLLGCTPAGPSGTYVTLQPDNPGYDQIFTVLQASKTAGKTIKIRVNTPSSNCSIAYVVATP
jgi:hypothetical protein